MKKNQYEENIDKAVVSDFGKEWEKFDQSEVPIEELKKSFDKYFSLFPWHVINNNSKGFDLGCGSGRWAYFAAQGVKTLHCIDPAYSALEVAKKKLKNSENCIFHNVGVDNIPLEDGSMDFGYSLGVLHHMPNTQDGISKCVEKLKVGAPFLMYIYYAFDNRPSWFKLIWKISDFFRKLIAVLPFPIKYFLSQIIAIFVYFPLSKISKYLDNKGIDVENIPLSSYKDKSFYSLRTDALDRFSTKLEKRFTKDQIKKMLINANLEKIQFRNGDPYWCVIGYKKR